MSGRKYPSGCAKRKKKLLESENKRSNTNNALLDKYFHRSDTSSQRSEPDEAPVVIEETVDEVESSPIIQEDEGEVSNTNPPVCEFGAEFGSDPALWPPTNPSLREYFAKKQPDQNAEFLCDSGRKFGEKMRVCTENNFYRRKQNGEVTKRHWLIYSRTANALFCYVCKLFSSSNDALCTTGLIDWHNVNNRLSSHETSILHRQSINQLSCLMKSSGRIDSLVVKESESEKAYWRNVLKRVVDVIKFIAQRGLSFFGENESFGSTQNGNFLGILELLATYDPFLAEHIQSRGNKGQGRVNYLSSTTVDELLHIMANRVMKQIVAEVKKARYFGIIVDSTPDLTHVDQLCVVIRYVDDLNEPVERFVTFVPIHSHAAEHLSETILKLFNEWEIDLQYCRGQSYDNASNMSGKYTGLQARIKKEYPLAEYVPCSGHSLNLVGINAVESCKAAISYFGFVQALYNFFSGSTHRWDLLTSNVDGLSLKSLSGTRWSANTDAVKALIKGYKNISETLKAISENSDENATTKYEAKCFFKKIQEFENALLTVIWDTLLQRLNSTNKSIQSYSCSIEAIVPLYNSLEKFVQSVRDSFEKFESEAEVLVTKCYIQSRKRKRPVTIDDSSSVDVNTDMPDRNRFIVQTHNVICDSLISNLKKRKEAYTFLHERFKFFFEDCDKKTRHEAVKHFQEIYKDDVDQEFVDEYEQFKEFIPVSTSPIEMYKTLKSFQIEDTYPNVEIALRMFLSIPISNCSGERSFSSMKRIKTRLRTSMSSNRLSELALLTVESDLTKSLVFEDVLHDFLSVKPRKKAM